VDDDDDAVGNVASLLIALVREITGDYTVLQVGGWMDGYSGGDNKRAAVHLHDAGD